MEEQSEKGAESNQNVVITSANAKKFVVKRLLNPIFFKVRFNVNNRSYLLDWISRLQSIANKFMQRCSNYGVFDSIKRLIDERLIGLPLLKMINRFNPISTLI